MSNAAAPQCSSGVESGWTLYLDGDDENESFISSERSPRIPGSHRSGWSRKEEDDGNNENLSMVSDASSGPPYCEVEEWSFHMSRGGSVAGSEQGSKKKDKGQQSGGRHSGYEDTACSRKQQNFDLPENRAPRRHASDFPRGYSVVNVEDESRYEEHRHWLQSPAVTDRKAASRKGGNSRKLM